MALAQPHPFPNPTPVRESGGNTYTQPSPSSPQPGSAQCGGKTPPWVFHSRTAQLVWAGISSALAPPQPSPVTGGGTMHECTRLARHCPPPSQVLPSTAWGKPPPRAFRSPAAQVARLELVQPQPPPPSPPPLREEVGYGDMHRPSLALDLPSPQNRVCLVQGGEKLPLGAFHSPTAQFARLAWLSSTPSPALTCERQGEFTRPVRHWAPSQGLTSTE